MHICFDHINIFDPPLLSPFTRYWLNSDQTNKPVCLPLEPTLNNPMSLTPTPPPPPKALFLTETLFPYIQIPKISLLDFGRLVGEEETFNEVMATIGH
jgi:hypothetical protein